MGKSSENIWRRLGKKLQDETQFTTKIGGKFSLSPN
jgi:hypothetical protein